MLDDGVGCHRREVRLEVVADALVVGEQQLPVAKDRVVPDVRGRDRREDPRPWIGVQPLVLVDRLRPHPDDLAEPPQRHAPPFGNVYVAGVFLLTGPQPSSILNDWR